MKLSAHSTHVAGLTTQNGLTLIEMMISMMIGLFLMIGTLTVYQQSRTNFLVADSIARLQENARFVIDTMEPDIRLANYWGISPGPSNIGAIPADVVITCDQTDTSAAMIPPTTYTAWTLNFRRQVQGVDESSGYGHPSLGIPCTPRGSAQNQSDALIVRHAGGQQAPLTNTVVQAHTGLNQAVIFNDGAVPASMAVAGVAVTQTHNVVANVYYVDQSSDLNPSMPSLRVKTLVAGGSHEDQELLAGVENLQVQLGISTDNDSDIERYVDANHAALNVPGVEIVAVRLWILIRAERSELGFTDIAQYVTPDTDFTITPCVPDNGDPDAPSCPYPNNHRRLTVSKTILLRNTR